MLLAIALAVVALACLVPVFFRPRSSFLPYPPNHSADVWSRCREFDAWDRRNRAKNIFAGLRLFSGTSDPRLLTIACRHWPHLLCWQWTLTWSRPFEGYERRFFRLHAEGPFPTGGRRITAHLFWLGYLSYHRQPYDRIAALGRKHFEAPRIFPREVLAA